MIIALSVSLVFLVLTVVFIIKGIKEFFRSSERKILNIGLLFLILFNESLVYANLLYNRHVYVLFAIWFACMSFLIVSGVYRHKIVFNIRNIVRLLNAKEKYKELADIFFTVSLRLCGDGYYRRLPRKERKLLRKGILDLQTADISPEEEELLYYKKLTGKYYIFTGILFSIVISWFLFPVVLIPFMILAV